MPHLHLSLQSGDDLILKRMKRRHSRARRHRFLRQVRRLRPDIALGADIIAGFPTETEEMFARSQDLVEECDLTFLHVFPYSKRPGTPAARMPQVAGEAIKERAKRLRASGRGGVAEAAGIGDWRARGRCWSRAAGKAAPSTSCLSRLPAKRRARCARSPIAGHDGARLTAVKRPRVGPHWRRAFRSI